MDPSSWWGRVSYALTIVPLAAAAECGAPVSILGLGGGGSDGQQRGGGALQRDDLRLPEMRRAVRAWKRVWRFSDPDIDWRAALNAPVHDSLQERVRRAQWAAHLESLAAVEALYGEEFDGLPSEAEREFARGWCRAARLFAEAAAHTDLDHCLLPLGAGYAPERMLTRDDDDGGGIAVPGSTTTGEATSSPAGDGDGHGDGDSAVEEYDALHTRRCVASVRWLGTLRAPVFGALRRLWRRSCGSYPARRKAAKTLREACYGGRRARAAACGKSFLFMFVPNLNYRKLTFPLGVDPAEELEYDPDFRPGDLAKPPRRRRPAGSLAPNPLQRPWYGGRKPDPSAGVPGAGWGEDDDGLLGGASSVVEGGMFPRGAEPVDQSFEARQRREREIMRDLRAAKAYRDKMMRQDSEGGSDANNGEAQARRRRGEGRQSGGGEEGGPAPSGGAAAKQEGGDAARSAKTVFM